jgi:hypothetical protein
VAETAGSDGLSGRAKPPSWPVWLARAGTLASVGLLALAGSRLLGAAGFEFRWNAEPGDVRVSPTGRSTRETGVFDPRTPAAGGVDANRASGSDSSVASDSRGVVMTPLQPPDVDDARLPPAGQGDRATIDFESFGSGENACTPCEVSDEWEEEGLRLSFRSWTAAADRPFVLDGSDYLPGGAGIVLGPPFREARGLEVGVIRLDFPDRPRSVSFAVYGPNIVPHFDIIAWTGRRIVTAAVDRAFGRTYDIAGRGLFREELITVRVEEGIDRISLDGWGPPGHMVLIDDLVITP